MLLSWALLEALDVGIVTFLAAAFILTVWRESATPPASSKWLERQLGLAYPIFLMGVSGVFAARGALRNFSAQPPPLLPVLLASTVFTISIALSLLGRRIATQVPLWGLVGFQSFRVLVELLLWGIHRQGVLPVQMTFEGYNFDILTGLSAIGLAWAAKRGRVSDRVLLIWNLGGLALLINIVTIAVLSMPTPLRAFMNGPANTIVAELPFVWIPCVMVQAALFVHILVFRALRMRSDAARPVQATPATPAT
jgi:hypothetical protein